MCAARTPPAAAAALFKTRRRFDLAVASRKDFSEAVGSTGAPAAPSPPASADMLSEGTADAPFLNDADMPADAPCVTVSPLGTVGLFD